MSINLKYITRLFYLDNYDLFGAGYHEINEDMIINNPSFIYSRLTIFIESGIPLQDSFSMMYSGNYFYHPVYGLCTCGMTLNIYKNKDFYYYITCSCFDRIVHQNEIFHETDTDLDEWDSRHSAHVPLNYFQKNFRKVLKIETIYVNDRPVICVYTLNLLDVMQTSPNHYEVGISIFYFVMWKDICNLDSLIMIFYPNFSEELVKQCRNIGLKSAIQDIIMNRDGDAYNMSVSRLRFLSSNLFNENKEFLTQECLKHILQWQENNLLSKKDLFFHAFTLKKMYDSQKQTFIDNVYLPIEYLSK